LAGRGGILSVLSFPPPPLEIKVRGHCIAPIQAAKSA
jgi:hypothetical protein